MSDFEIKGAGEFLKLSKALKAAGRTELRKELNKRMRQAGRPLIPEVRAAAQRELPQSGGLAKRMAKRPIRVVTRTGASSAGVTLVMPKTQEGYNDGVIRHPVFEKDKASRKGRKRSDPGGPKWVTQRVGPGRWFDDEIVAKRGKVVPLLEAAIQSVIEDIERGAR